MNLEGWKVLSEIVKHFIPPPELTVSQWADAHRMLSSEAASEPGFWDTGRAEYQRGMMDVVNLSAIDTVVIMSSAQIGKTEIINNIVGALIDNAPCQILVDLPTD